MNERRNLDEQLDALEEQAFLETVYPEPGWTTDEIEEYERSTKNGRPSEESK